LVLSAFTSFLSPLPFLFIHCQAEIERRAQKAIERYEASQGTAKPQKKKSKVMHRRPSEVLQSMTVWQLPLPLPTTHVPEVFRVMGKERLVMKGTERKMTHSARCFECKVSGTANDVVMHERIEHVAKHLRVPDERGEAAHAAAFLLRVPDEGEAGLAALSKFSWGTELHDVMASSRTKMIHSSGTFKWEYPDFLDGNVHVRCKTTTCLITVGSCVISIALSQQNSSNWEEKIDVHISICSRIGKEGSLPQLLMESNFTMYDNIIGDSITSCSPSADCFITSTESRFSADREDCLHDPHEGNTNLHKTELTDLKQALGLKATLPGELVAGLLALSFPKREYWRKGFVNK
jgi:hypothetical protein